jgi:glucokinase
MQERLKFLGIEIGGTKLQLVKTTAFGSIEQTLRYEIDPASGAEGIRRQLAEGLLQLNAATDVAAIGVGFGGPVDREKGIIRTSHQVNGWAGFNLAGWLSDKTGKPVVIENDANTAALAEALHGSGQDHQTVFYMTIGSGIGGGLVINKEIYHGKEPGEVEVGHLRLTKAGETVEEKCSGWAVNKKVKGFIAQEPNGLLSQLVKQQKGHEAKLLQQALEQGDNAAQMIIEETADDLAFALSHVVHLFHPDVLILGGGLSLLKEYLRKPVEAKLRHYVMQAFLPPPPVVIALLEENAVPIGAIELAKKCLLQHQLHPSTQSVYETLD